MLRSERSLAKGAKPLKYNEESNHLNGKDVMLWMEAVAHLKMFKTDNETLNHKKILAKSLRFYLWI